MVVQGLTVGKLATSVANAKPSALGCREITLCWIAMNFRKKWRAYLIAGALAILALGQFAVIAAGAAGWFNHH